MGRGQQQVGAVRAAEVGQELLLVRARLEEPGHGPPLLVLTQAVGHRTCEQARALVGRGVVLRPGSEDRQAYRARRAVKGSRHHVLGIGGVPAGVLEGQAAHGVLDGQLGLEEERDLVGTTHEQQVVGQHLRTHRSGPGPVPGHEGVLGLSGLIAELPGELPVETLRGGRRLASAELQQRPQGGQHVGIGPSGEDHTPAGLGQVAGVDAETRPQMVLGAAAVPLQQRTRRPRLVVGDAEHGLRQLVRTRRWQEILPARRVDTVDNEHGPPPRRAIPRTRGQSPGLAHDAPDRRTEATATASNKPEPRNAGTRATPTRRTRALSGWQWSGTPSRTRTANPLIKSQLLCQLS